jgi:hypothetical protein
MLDPAQSQRAREGEYSMARRRWQQGTVYPRRSKTLPDAWWGRYVETVQSENGVVMRVHRNVFLGEAGSKDGQLTKPLAKRALWDYVDKAKLSAVAAARSRTIGRRQPVLSIRRPLAGRGPSSQESVNRVGDEESHQDFSYASIWQAGNGGPRLGARSILIKQTWKKDQPQVS